MADQGEAVERNFKARLRRSLKAWLVLTFVMIPATLAAFAGSALLSISGEFSFVAMAVGLAVGIAYCVPLALAFSVLGAPFVFLRRWIVTPIAPHMRVGYLAVVLYGPVLLWLFQRTQGGEDFPFGTFVVFYEVIAYLATMFFARVWRSMGMFEVDAAAWGPAPA